MNSNFVCICGNNNFSRVFVYTVPPKEEVRFESVQYDNYYREILKCDLCGHFISTHQMDLKSIYTGDYVASNYKGVEGIHENFKRIISLDPVESDNIGRTARINGFARKHFSKDVEGRTLLDIGSGLGVFPHVMKQSGWVCTALDPDANAVEHLDKFVKVRTVQGDFSKKIDLYVFDVVTLNKVLEHVKDPLRLLSRVRDNVKPDGFVYVEVPDCEAAVNEGREREEFFIDHLHVFSAASLSLLVSKSGLELKYMERFHEPSSKYTLCAFMVTKL